MNILDKVKITITGQNAMNRQQTYEPSTAPLPAGTAPQTSGEKSEEVHQRASDTATLTMNKARALAGKLDKLMNEGFH